jgi:hypothetical protein
VHRPDEQKPLWVAIIDTDDFINGVESNLCGVFVYESAGILSGLEVTGYAVDAPKLSQIRPNSGHLI